MFDPYRNQLLAALPTPVWQQISSRLEWVDLQAGSVLYRDSADIEHVHFPTTAVVSLMSTLSDGSQAEVAVVGNEGFVGVCAFMGGGPSLSSAVVQSAGRALRMTAYAVRDESRQLDALMQQLMRYTQTLFVHMAQNSACIRHHALDQQLARWLLLNHDRLGGAELQITQERIANTLGVRRETITAGALKLQQAGLIRYSRGRIAILDRSGLEERSCECYALVKDAYDRLSRDCDCAPASPLPLHDMSICRQAVVSRLA
ncbi:MAG: Crp/Fnr family transcriptional regulator [Burkholderiales bacterium]|nr:Crp/Fnr family transcriptional regulator [Burkholderiales bacterium]